jgi:hypothetical protein
MKSIQTWFWKVTGHPIWGTFTTRTRMSADEVQASYPEARTITAVEGTMRWAAAPQASLDVAASPSGAARCIVGSVQRLQASH